MRRSKASRPRARGPAFTRTLLGLVGAVSLIVPLGTVAPHATAGDFCPDRGIIRMVGDSRGPYFGTSAKVTVKSQTSSVVSSICDPVFAHGVEIRYDSTHWVYLYYGYPAGCTSGRGCIGFWFQWQDGAYSNTDNVTYSAPVASCESPSELIYLTVRSNVRGVWDARMGCTKDTVVTVSSTSNYAPHPTLSFASGKSASEVNIATPSGTDTSAWARADLIQEKTSLDATGAWKDLSIAAQCGQDTIRGWDGATTVTPSDSATYDVQVKNDTLGC